MDVTSLLTWLGRSGALSSVPRAGVAGLTGFAQVLTRRSSVTGLLNLPDVTVPYAGRSALLGLEAFPLALDGPAHEHARTMIAGVLASTADAHASGVDRARAAAGRAMALAGSRVDVTSALVEPALLAWAETWFGLPGRGVSLLRSARLVMHATFLNPTSPKGSVDAGGLAAAVGWVEGQRGQLADLIPTAPAGTLAAALMEATSDAATAARHLLALTVGPLALGGWSLHLAIADLLDRSWVLDAIQTDTQAGVAYLSALRRQAPLPGVLRNNPSLRKVPGTCGLVAVPPGPVLVATGCADRLDPEASGLPLAFGYGAHQCLGPAQITDVAAVILRAFGARSPRWPPGRRRRAGADPGPSGVRSWPFPGRLTVHLLR